MTPELTTTNRARQDDRPGWGATAAMAAGGAVATAGAVASTAAPLARAVVVRIARSRATALLGSPIVVGAVASYFMGPVPVLLVIALVTAT